MTVQESTENSACIRVFSERWLEHPRGTGYMGVLENKGQLETPKLEEQDLYCKDLQIMRHPNRDPNP